jgi:hypothetical protein
MLEPVVNCGVTFWLKLIFGVTVPPYNPELACALLLGYSTKCVNVPVLVLVVATCGKLKTLVGLAPAVAALVPLVTLQPVLAVLRSV